MKNKINLRFLLALGSQKVVVLSQQETTDIYSSQAGKTPNVSIQRISEAVSGN